MVRRLVIVTGAALVLLGSAACSDGREPEVAVERSETTLGGSKTEASTAASTATTTAVTTTTTTPAVDPAANALAYFQGIDSSDPDVVASTGATLASPGSPALAYAQFRAAQTRAYVVSGDVADPFEFEVQDDGSVRGCPPDGVGDEGCVVFDELVADEQGLLKTFSVNGNGIAGRVVGANGASAVAAGATVTVLGGLEFNNAVGFGVVLEVRAGDAVVVPPGPSNVTYVGPDGVQYSGDSSASIYAYDDLQPGAATTSMLSFAGGQVGGSITVEVCPDDFRGCETVSLPVA